MDLIFMLITKFIFIQDSLLNIYCCKVVSFSWARLVIISSLFLRALISSWWVLRSWSRLDFSRIISSVDIVVCTWKVLQDSCFKYEIANIGISAWKTLDFQSGLTWTSCNQSIIDNAGAWAKGPFALLTLSFSLSNLAALSSLSMSEDCSLSSLI